MSKRVALTDEQKIEYLVADLPFLFEKEAKKRNKNAKDLAHVLGITPQAFWQRKKRQENGKPKDVFTYGEILRLFKFLDMDEDEQARFFPKLR